MFDLPILKKLFGHNQHVSLEQLHKENRNMKFQSKISSTALRSGVKRQADLINNPEKRREELNKKIDKIFQ